MFCAECGSELKENERFCSKCGTPVTPGNGAYQTPGEAPKADTARMLEAAYPAVMPVSPAGGAGQAPKPDGGKKGKKPKAKVFIITGAAVAVVALVGTVLGVNASRLSNMFRKTFSSPEEYYQSVEQKAVKGMASAGGDVYGTALEAIDIFDMSAETELTVSLGKRGEELLKLAGMTGVDLSWLKSVSVGMDYSLKDEILGGGVSFSLNGSKLLSGNLVMDVKNDKMYAQIPELSKSYIGVSMEDAGYSLEELHDAMQDYQENMKEIMAALPTQAAVEELAQKYLDLVISNVGDVEQTKGETLEAEGVSQKVTELEVTVNSKNLKKILKAVLKEARNDKEIKNILENYMEYMASMYESMGYSLDSDWEEAWEEIYEEFQEEIDSILEDLEEYGIEDFGEITMKVYVDGQGAVKGRIIEIDDVSIRMLTPEKGGEIGYELSFEYDEESLALSGSGKKSGGKVTGDFALKYNDDSLIEIAVKGMDEEKLEKGQLEGTFEIKAGADIQSLADLYYEDYRDSRHWDDWYKDEYKQMKTVLSMLEDLKLTIKSSSSDKGGSFAIGVLYDGEEIGEISMTTKTAKGTKTSIPSAKETVMIKDDEDLMDWLDTMDLKDFVSALEKTNMPKDWVEAVEEIAEMIEDGDLDGLERQLYY